MGTEITVTFGGNVDWIGIAAVVFAALSVLVAAILAWVAWFQLTAFRDESRLSRRPVIRIDFGPPEPNAWGRARRPDGTTIGRRFWQPKVIAGNEGDGRAFDVFVRVWVMPEGIWHREDLLLHEPQFIGRIESLRHGSQEPVRLILNEEWATDEAVLAYQSWCKPQRLKTVYVDVEYADVYSSSFSSKRPTTETVTL